MSTKLILFTFFLIISLALGGCGGQEFSSGQAAAQAAQPTGSAQNGQTPAQNNALPAGAPQPQVETSGGQEAYSPLAMKEAAPQPGAALTTVLPDTGQVDCYDNTGAVMACPAAGQALAGQDASYTNRPPAYQDNGDGVITDLNTGLMWQKTPAEKMTYAQAAAGAEAFTLAGYDDWRLPTIKELYSLIDFSGRTGMTTADSVPYIDTSYFDFEYGNTGAGERLIDAQYWSGTEYVGATMNGAATVFGVNFADGRIKGYPRDTGAGGSPMTQFVRYVRGGTGSYGANQYMDNGDGTISDLSTGLVWMQADSGRAMSWEEALAYAESFEAAGYSDWRLPNAKELQSIVDYSRAPDATDPAARRAAIDPIFSMTDEDSFFWTSTSHVDGPQGGDKAVYIAFGLAWGYMEQPSSSGNYVLQNVHGAGAQRSDPKIGDPADYPHGFGPQGDMIRIYNYVRLVRGGQSSSAAQPAANSAQPAANSAQPGAPASQPSNAPSLNGLPTQPAPGDSSSAADGPSSPPCRPDLASAATGLGISEETLRSALGPPTQNGPDFASAAAQLGISEETLRTAMQAAMQNCQSGSQGLPPNNPPPGQQSPQP